MIVGRTLFPYVVLCLIPLTTYLGDRVILTTSSSLPLIVKCAVDNLTHLLVALFSYIYVICSQDFRKKELAVFASLCGVLASFIDVDHFIAAGSLNLKVIKY